MRLRNTFARYLLDGHDAMHCYNWMSSQIVIVIKLSLTQGVEKISTFIDISISLHS